MKSIVCLIFTISFILLSQGVTGQSPVIRGVVLDMETNKPLPLVSIVYNAKNQGFISDIDGKFVIRDLNGIDFLKFSYVGYAPKTIGKEYLLKNHEITVYLVQETYDLKEVTVYPGENPAHRIIRNVLDNKRINNPEDLHSYSCTMYNKMIFTADLEGALKSSGDTINMADSVLADTSFQRARDFLSKQHLFLMEAVSERNYRKPGKIDEKVIASRVSGFRQPSFILIATQIQSFSFYNEMVTLLDSRYISPISSGSTSRYLFLIEDTSFTSQGDTVFRISFRPKKNRNFEALKGVLYINSNKYAIQSVIAEPVDNNGMIDLKITQNYEMIDDKHWFPVELNTDMVFSRFVEGKVGDKAVKFVGTGKSYLSNIRINEDLKEVKFKAVELSVSDDAYKKNDSLWLRYRRDSLTNQELKTYSILDSIGEKEKLDFKLKVIKTVSSGFIPYHFIDLNILSILDFNVFEGFRPGLGFRTNDKISVFFSLGAYGAYGFKDKEWKYGANIDFLLSGLNQVHLEFRYKHDVEESSGFAFFDNRPGFTSTEGYRGFFIADMTYSDQFRLDFSFRALKGLKFNIYGKESVMRNPTAYRFYNGTDLDAANYSYKIRESGIQMRYAPNESLAYMAGEIISMNTYHSPVLYLNLIRGFRSGESGFDYTKAEAKLDVNFLTKTFGRTNIQIVGGKVFGNLPYFLLYNGHESYYDFAVETANSFATMRMNEFLSDEFVSVHYRQDFGGLLFKAKKFRPKIILANSVGIGRLAKPGLHQDITFKTLDRPYFETGIIINNIIRQLGFIGYGFGTYYRYGPHSFSNISDNFAWKLTLTFEL